MECGLTNLTLTSSLNRRLAIGESIILQCSAVDPTGSGLSFQWFKDNLLIPGQSSSMLLLNVVGPSDIGTYACQVSNRLDKKSQAFYLSLFGGATVDAVVIVYVPTVQYIQHMHDLVLLVKNINLRFLPILKGLVKWR